MQHPAIIAGLAALTLAGAAQAQDQQPAAAPAAPAAPVRQTPQQLKEALTQSQAEAAGLRQQLDEARTALKAAQAQGQQAQAQLSAAGSTLQACNAKNVELIKVGYEILDRYKRADLDDVLARKEPFTGLKRVQVQNLAQGYEDQLRAGVYDYRRDKAPRPPKAAVTEPSSH